MKNYLMRTLKTSLTFMLALTLVLPGLTAMSEVTVKAGTMDSLYGNKVAGGNCGEKGKDDDSVTWSVYDNGLDGDMENGSYDILVISGTGKMMDFNGTPSWPTGTITRLFIEEGVTGIGAYSFYQMNELQTVDIAETVTGIGNYAFGYCYNVESITLPEKLTSIGRLAFHYCSSLKEITIPGTVSNFGENAFCACQSLEKATILYGVKELPADTFQACEKLKVLVLPESITEISYGYDGGFNGCDSLESIVYPAGMTGVEIAELPEVTTQFTYAEDPDDSNKVILTIVSYGVNENGDVKDEVTIPDEVNGKKVKSITVDGALVSNPITIKHDGHNFNTEPTCTKEELCTVCGELYSDPANHASAPVLINVKEATCKEAGYTGDTYCNDCQTTIATGDSIPKLNTHTWDAGKVTKEPTDKTTGVMTYTCNVCRETKTESIPTLEESTGQGESDIMPAEKEALKKGTIINDTASKGRYKVTVSDVSKGTVQYIKPTGKNAKKVTIPATITKNGVTYKVTGIAGNTFKNNKKITQVTIGKNVKTIGTKAFYGCTGLKTVRLGSGLTSIGTSAFAKCTALTKITIPGKVTKIGNNAFYGCKNLKSVTIGKNVNTIGTKAFFKCSKLTKITIPGKVKKIGRQAFYGCSRLKTITIKTTKLNSRNVGSNAFKGIAKKATIKVPKARLKAYKTLLVRKGVSKTATIKK